MPSLGSILSKFWFNFVPTMETNLSKFFDDLVQILGLFRTSFGSDFGANFGASFVGAMGAVGSQGGLKQHKIEKATELPLLFEVGRK
jgi:hypothetical protein